MCHVHVTSTSRRLQNADGTRPELYKLDLWNASNPQPDFNERHNLAATYPDRVAVLKAAVEVRILIILGVILFNYFRTSCADFTS